MYISVFWYGYAAYGLPFFLRNFCSYKKPWQNSFCPFLDSPGRNCISKIDVIKDNIALISYIYIEIFVQNQSRQKLISIY